MMIEISEIYYYCQVLFLTIIILNAKMEKNCVIRGLPILHKIKLLLFIISKFSKVDYYCQKLFLAKRVSKLKLRNFVIKGFCNFAKCDNYR